MSEVLSEVWSVIESVIKSAGHSLWEGSMQITTKFRPELRPRSIGGHEVIFDSFFSISMYKARASPP